MKSSVEALEGNKVKVIVEVDSAEFDKDLEVAFKALAREVRLPGFRPGKAPRKVIEARIGTEYARQEAFRSGLPNYYVEAVKEHEVDVIASPDIEIVEGELSGDVTFEATVEIRPSVAIEGYENLRAEIPSPILTDSDLEEAIDRLRGQFAQLVTVERPAQTGDRVTIDIAAEHEGEPVPGLTAQDYVYEVGIGAVVEELDEHLVGAEAGSHIEFTADHPDEDEDEPLEFWIEVKEVQESVLPELDDEFAQANTEFVSAEELRESYRTRLSRARIIQAETARRNAVAEAVAALVPDDEVPAALIELEVENRAQDLALRLQAQGLTIEQYLQFSGQEQGAFVAELRSTADVGAKMDLALRSVAAAEGLEATEEDLVAEFTKIAEQVNRSVDDVRDQLIKAGQLQSIRSDLIKSKALDWLVERVELVDPDGNPIDPGDLVLPPEPEPEPEADDALPTIVVSEDSLVDHDADTADSEADSTEGEPS